MASTLNFEDLYLKQEDIGKSPFSKAPKVEVRTYLVGGQLKEWKGENYTVHSPIHVKSDPNGPSQKQVIGSYPMQGLNCKEYICSSQNI